MLMVVPLSQLFPQWVQTSGPLQGAVQTLAVSGVAILAGTQSGGVYSSSNGGVDWIEANNGLKSPGQNASVLSLAVKGGLVFAGTDQLPLYRSADLGLHWDGVGTGLPNQRADDLRARGRDLPGTLWGRDLYLN